MVLSVVSSAQLNVAQARAVASWVAWQCGKCAENAIHTLPPTQLGNTAFAPPNCHAGDVLHVEFGELTFCPSTRLPAPPIRNQARNPVIEQGKIAAVVHPINGVNPKARFDNAPRLASRKQIQFDHDESVHNTKFGSAPQAQNHKTVLADNLRNRTATGRQ